MDLKTKLNNFNATKIFKIIYILILAANMAFIILTYGYFQKNVYFAINPENLTEFNINELTHDINMENIEIILKNIDKKSQIKNHTGINNIFD